MLVLSRKLNQKIRIDGEIEIIVVRIDRNHVRLAISAPDHIKIMRNELCSEVELPEPDQDGPGVGPGLLGVGGDAVPQGGDGHVLAPPASWRAFLQSCCPVREVTGRSVGPIGPGKHGADGRGPQAAR